jgi:phosphatidylserine/phosphatidylglycerophosphate/cardiolipin synthase-like enzyme
MIVITTEMWLLLATGFTGGMSLIFLVRLLYRNLTDTPTVAAYFCPQGGCTDAVVQHLGKARKEILILARSFAHEPLSKAVLDAKMRGARVEIILDCHNEKDPTSNLHLFADQGLAPRLDAHFTCLHDNLILIDGRVVLLGSFDFTKQSEEANSDSMLIVSGYPHIVSACRAHFQRAKSHAEEYRRPAATPKPEKDDKKAAPTIADPLAKKAA